MSSRPFHFYLHLIFLLSFILSFCSCIDSYDFNSGNQNKVLVVEGLLTDDVQNPDTIKIQYSIDFGAFIRKEPIASVKAFIIETTSKKEIPLLEKIQGSFLPPVDFKINPDEKYVLRFTLPNNQQYESTPQQIIKTPPIAKIYDIFSAKSRISDDGKQFLSANDVFIDFQEDQTKKNFYLWRYTHYERLGYCATCTNQIYDSNTERCIEKGSEYFFLREPYYDYACSSECYTIFKGNQVNVFSDITSNGRLIQGRLIAKIPFYNYAGCLVEVQQMCISPEAYNFYKVLESQSQTTGGLADTPPAAIVGNIKNTQNSSERVVGYFGVADIQKKRIWIDRADATGTTALILGHIIIPEPPTGGPPFRPPFAPCKPSITRTNIRPEGWR